MLPIKDRIKLARLVQERPNLYDKELKQSISREHCTELWNEVATEMQLPFFRCKWLWSSLRDSYIRFLTTSDHYSRKRQNWLDQCMGFMYEHIPPQKIGRTISDDTEGQIDDGKLSSSSLTENTFSERKKSRTADSPSFVSSSSFLPKLQNEEKSKLQEADTTNNEPSADPVLMSCNSSLKPQCDISAVNVNAKRQCDKTFVNLEPGGVYPMIKSVDTIASDNHKLPKNSNTKVQKEIEKTDQSKFDIQKTAGEPSFLNKDLRSSHPVRKAAGTVVPCMSDLSDLKVKQETIQIEKTTDWPNKVTLKSQCETNKYDCDQSYTVVKKVDEDHPIIKFVETIVPDIHKLSERRKRQFKLDVLMSLNKMLEVQDMES